LAVIRGLTTEQVREQFKQGNFNEQVDSSAKSVNDIIRENVFTYFNLIFAILSVLVIIAGNFRSLTFLPVIIINTLIGIIQEYRAKKTLDNLSVMNQPTAKTVRDGQLVSVPTDQLVLGDVIQLTAGQQIPADAKVTDGSISVNESLLTGEADEILKRRNSDLMSGSFVVSGKCYATLTRVGKNSYISQLTEKAKAMPKGEQSEMIRDINLIIKIAGIAIIPMGILLFIQSFFVTHAGFSKSIDSMVAAVVGMVPEGLYLLVSIALALSSMRLAKKKVLLHDMKSIETLARVNIFCVDKTGTITDNQMDVRGVYPLQEMMDEEGVERLIGAYIQLVPDNNQTMDALRNYFKDAGIMQATHVQPFSSKTKYSAVQTLDCEYRLGAPDFLLEGYLINRYENQIGEYEDQGLRVLTFICIQNGVIQPLAFITIENHIRADAIETFRYFHDQDVEIKVISGDNPLTVSRIAERAGIENADCYINAMELDSKDKIRDAVQKYTVFGRVTPEQKKMIIESLKEQGNTVAMTGDGVNDILAMKDADCSIAMGSGSEAAMQAAQVVLLDSDFSHMTNIVSEGRKDINNIERSATLFLVKNIFSILLGLFSVIWLNVYPLKPAQVGLISAFNIGVPAFLLALESNTKRQGKNFLKRILLKALPAALTAFVVIAAMAKFGEEFSLKEDDVSVAATYLFAIVGFMILIFISRPMNKYRYGVLVLCVIGLLLTSVFFRTLFSITPISRQCFMLLVIFAICTEPFFRYLTWMAERIDQSFYKRKEKAEIRRRMRREIQKIDNARKDGEF